MSLTHEVNVQGVHELKGCEMGSTIHLNECTQIKVVMVVEPITFFYELQSGHSLSYNIVMDVLK
jgi:hypothetical protein